MNYRAGKSTRKMAARRRANGWLWLVVGFVAILVVNQLLFNSPDLDLGNWGIILLFPLLGFLLNLAETFSRKQYKAERRAERGAVAEERIGNILSELGEGYLVLHDIVSPYGNIDHLVISRQAGIFLIETKAHGGRVSFSQAGLLVNSHAPEKDFVAQALRNVYWLRQQVAPLLGKKPWITALIVFTNAFVEAGRPVRGVSVINGKYLLRFIQRPAPPKPENEMLWEKRHEILRAL